MHHFIGPVFARLYLPQCNENCQQNRFSFPHVAVKRNTQTKGDSGGALFIPILIRTSIGDCQEFCKQKGTFYAIRGVLNETKGVSWTRKVSMSKFGSYLATMWPYLLMKFFLVELGKRVRRCVGLVLRVALSKKVIGPGNQPIFAHF